MIKAITFDLDGVYFSDSSFRNFKIAMAAKSANPELVDQVLSKSDEMMNFKKGIVSEPQYWDYARQALGFILSNDQIFQALRGSYEVNSDVSGIVKKVRELGIKTCICSNNFVTRIRELNTKFNFLTDFDVQIFSYQIGATKPDPKIYQTLISASSCKPDEIVYSDDKLDNVVAAQNLGINSFVYQNFPDFLSRLRDLGVTI